MFELRILNGLHRGATLPLDDDSQLSIGSSDDSDIVLVDPGIMESHAVLSRVDGAWVLTATEGELRNADSNETQALIDIMPGDFARVGKIWLTIVSANARWQDPPSEPVDVSFDAMVADSRPEPVIAAENVQVATSSVSPTPDVNKNAKPRSKSKWKMRPIIVLPIIMVTVLSAATYAMTARPSLHEHKRLDSALGAESSSPSKAENKISPLGADSSKQVEQLKTGAEATGADASKSGMTPEELRKAFRSRLSDAQLLKLFDMTLTDESWEMQANLDDEETSRFERVLKGFMTDHNITFPVHAKVVGAEGMLPFKIRQVITGVNAGVVTQDGTRLYLGDEYHGIRVVAIQDNHLTFAGKRKIEMNW